MAQIYPNAEASVGTIAIFHYPLKHIAYVEYVDEEGVLVSECNYNDGECGMRWVPFTYAPLTGFFMVE